MTPERELAAMLSAGSGVDFDSPLSIALKAMMYPAKKLGEALFDFDSVEDLREWLAKQQDGE